MDRIDSLMRDIRDGYSTGGAPGEAVADAGNPFASAAPSAFAPSPGLTPGANPATAAAPGVSTNPMSAANIAPVSGERPISGQLTNAMSAPPPVTGLEGSGMYHNVVRDAYQRYLGRDVDDVGLSYWADQLAKDDFGYEDLARSISSSPEALGNADRLVDLYYQQELGRAPDEAGKTAWLGQVRSGAMPLSSLRWAINDSDEGRIHDLYQDVFGRAPDIEGRDYWLNQKSNGLSEDEIARIMGESQEARNRHGGKTASDASYDRSRSLADHYRSMGSEGLTAALRDLLWAEGGVFARSPDYKSHWAEIVDSVFNRAASGYDLFSKGWKNRANLNDVVDQIVAPKQYSGFVKTHAKEAEEYFRLHPEAKAQYDDFIRERIEAAASGEQGSGVISYLNKKLVPGTPWAQGKGRDGYHLVESEERPGTHHSIYTKDGYTERALQNRQRLAEALKQGKFGFDPPPPPPDWKQDVKQGEPQPVSPDPLKMGPPGFEPGVVNVPLPEPRPADIELLPPNGITPMPSGQEGLLFDGGGWGSRGHLAHLLDSGVQQTSMIDPNSVNRQYFEQQQQSYVPPAHNYVPPTQHHQIVPHEPVHHAPVHHTPVHHTSHASHGSGGVDFLVNDGVHTGGNFNDYASSHGFGHTTVGQHHVPYNHLSLPGAGGFDHGHHGSSHNGWHGGYWDPNWANSSMHSGGDQSFFKSGGRVGRADGGAANGGEQNDTVDDALRRMGFSAGGSGPDENEREQWLRDQLAGSAPQYVEENDFPARAARGVEAVDRYAGAANNALASIAAAPSMRSQEGRRASEIVSSAIPPDPNAVSRDALARWREGDRAGAVEEMVAGMPQTGMFLGPKAKTVDLEALQRARRESAGGDAPRPYGDLFDRVEVAPKGEEEIRQATGWHRLGPNWWTETVDRPSMFRGREVLDEKVEDNLRAMRERLSHVVSNLSDRDLRKQIKSNLIHSGYEGRAREFWDDPNLWRAYPQLADMPVVVDATQGRKMIKDPNTGGMVGRTKSGQTVMALRGPVGRDQKEGSDIFVHEMQHGIQEIEGAPGGSNVTREANDPAVRPAFTRYQEALTSNPDLMWLTEQVGTPEFESIVESRNRIFKERMNEALRGSGREPVSMTELSSTISDQLSGEFEKQYPLYGRIMEIERDLRARGIPVAPPPRFLQPFEGYLANAGEAQARNSTYRLGWDEDRRRATSPLLTIPRDSRATDAAGFYDPWDLIYRADGGRVGLASGGAPDDDEDKSRFIHDQLNSGERQLPQSDPEAGGLTAKRAGLMAAGLAPGSGLASASGYFPKAEGGFEPSMRDDWREGRYFDAGMKALGAAGDAAYAVPGIGTVVGGALKAPLAAKLAMAGAPAARVGRKAAEAAETASTAAKAERAAGAAEGASSSLWTPSAPKIIRSSDIEPGSVHHILQANGYRDIPEDAPFRDVLREQARFFKPSELRDQFSEAIRAHMSMSPLEKRRHSNEVMREIVPYLGQTSKGQPLSLLSQNTKLQKAGKQDLDWEGVGVETNGCSLSPALQWGGVNLCPNHGVCKGKCLGKTSNQAYMQGGGEDIYGLANDEGKGNIPRLNQLARSILMFQRPDLFATRLSDQIAGKNGEAFANGRVLGMRLNTLSDLPPSVMKPFHEAHPDVMFYDYSKLNTNPASPNHHITYSSTGVSSPLHYNPYANWDGPGGMEDRLMRGDNVAMVFSHGDELPSVVESERTGKVWNVVSGDEHDFRPMDKTPDGEPGVIVGLKNKDTKTKMRRDMDFNVVDSGGFMVRYDPEYMRGEAREIMRGKRKGEVVPGDLVRDDAGNPIPTNRKAVIEDQRKFRPNAKRSSGGRVDMKPEHFWQQFHNHDHYADTGVIHHPEWWEVGQPSASKRRG